MNEMREHRRRLGRLIGRGFVLENGVPLWFGGCYVAGTGTNAETQVGFVGRRLPAVDRGRKEGPRFVVERGAGGRGGVSALDRYGPTRAGCIRCGRGGRGCRGVAIPKEVSQRRPSRSSWFHRFSLRAIGEILIVFSRAFAPSSASVARSNRHRAVQRISKPNRPIRIHRTSKWLALRYSSG